MMARLSSTPWTFAADPTPGIVAGERSATSCGAGIARDRFRSSETVMDTGIQIHGPVDSELEAILSPEALAFVAALHRRFNPRRRALLHAREERQAAIDEGAQLEFLAETRSVRNANWQVASAPGDLLDRRVEITGPCDRKMVINALNS
jgi:malate synthase